MDAAAQGRIRRRVNNHFGPSAYLRSPSRKSISKATITMLVLVLVAFFVRTISLDFQSLWRDEVDVQRFSGWSPEKLAGSIFHPGHNGSVYYVIMRFWLHLAGDSEFGLRFLSACFSVLAVALVWRVARTFVGRRAGLVAALLSTVSAYYAWYGQDAKMYAMVGALTLLAMLSLLRALATNRVLWWVAFVASASLSFYIHMLSALMVIVYGLLMLLCWPTFKRRWRAGVASLAVLTLPYVPLAVWQLPWLLSGYDTGHPTYSPRQMLSLLFSLYTRGVAQVGGWVVVAAFLFAVLMGLFAKDRAGSSSVRDRLFLALWMLVPVFSIYLISFRVPVFEPRYLIFVAPAFYILAARGIVALGRFSPPVAAVTLAVVLVVNSVAIGIQATQPLKSDFRQAAAFVAGRREQQEPVLFQMPYIQYTFDYYYPRPFVTLEAPWTNGDRPQAEINKAMSQLTAPYTSLWLVESEDALWDNRDLVLAWLQQHGQLIDSAHFALVDVYHYRLTDH